MKNCPLQLPISASPVLSICFPQFLPQVTWPELFLSKRWKAKPQIASGWHSTPSKAWNSGNEITLKEEACNIAYRIDHVFSNYTTMNLESPSLPIWPQNHILYQITVIFSIYEILKDSLVRSGDIILLLTHLLWYPRSWQATPLQPHCSHHEASESGSGE